MVNVAATCSTGPEAGLFLLNLRQSTVKNRVMSKLTWLVITPAFAAWTVTGTFWIAACMPDKMPGGMHSWLLMVWQVLSYAWFFVYGIIGICACYFERRLCAAETDLRSFVDGEVLARWGNVSSLASYQSLPTEMAAGSMSPASIRRLPGIGRYRSGSGNAECSICLEAFQEDESMRELAECQHVFHRSCVDLWLLRSSDCPLCKTKVKETRAE
jgi:hypothetical protein